jgi:glycosyltransferase involved in cell wall biosynthesis
VALLTQHTHGLPVCIVGADNPIPAPPVPIRADVRVSTGEHEISVKGAQTESQLRTLYSKSTIFAATSQYEPTGLASIEAAFSRCALVANDTEVYRELWGDAALYFERNNAESLSEVLSQLDGDRELARLYGTRAYNRARERFTARRMVDDYLRLYRRCALRKSRSRKSRTQIRIRASLTGCGKSWPCACFWVAQRFSAAVSALFLDCGFSR